MFPWNLILSCVYRRRFIFWSVCFTTRSKLSANKRCKIVSILESRICIGYRATIFLGICKFSCLSEIETDICAPVEGSSLRRRYGFVWVVQIWQRLKSSFLVSEWRDKLLAPTSTINFYRFNYFSIHHMSVQNKIGIIRTIY